MEKNKSELIEFVNNNVVLTDTFVKNVLYDLGISSYEECEIVFGEDDAEEAYDNDWYIDNDTLFEKLIYKNYITSIDEINEFISRYDS
jgi:hypothetical protein